MIVLRMKKDDKKMTIVCSIQPGSENSPLYNSFLLLLWNSLRIFSSSNVAIVVKTLYLFLYAGLLIEYKKNWNYYQIREKKTIIRQVFCNTDNTPDLNTCTIKSVHKFVPYVVEEMVIIYRY